MEPAIPAGTKVLVDTDWSALAAGDVVCFLDGEDGSWTMHRVLARVRLFGRDWVVQAPERGGEGTVVPADRVIGRVVGVDSDLRRPLTPFERVLLLDSALVAAAVRLRTRFPAAGAVLGLLSGPRRSLLRVLRR
jgi:hypothetical protein